ncbi:hypothetical protein Ade02nite_84730 [Paractinoplanes deccanensis]|uniref:Polysaccharide pyruvyl transferase domain-containing protein n=1 Tax=Paractinoplanes deccanensis TaxID=113561 RepID=A0ABQ3YIN6_9ACTN|nr:polysaccharide pyruvyl transferase family protein [Actinoplanes deccanensis]GID79832.1 hypothetical protein Ade02nite_84730 [Actinoplanes deccanensis]
MTIVCANHWHDDNKGDSAISAGILRLVRRHRPAAPVRMVSMHEAHQTRFAGSGRHLAASASGEGPVPLEGAWCPTELGSARSGPAALRAARWLIRLIPSVAEVLTGRMRARTRRRLEGAGALVLVGGSNIYDNPDVLPVLSYARLFTVLYPAWAAGRLGIPVILAGHTLGPFPRRLGLRIAATMLRGVRHCALRESTSIPEARRLGLRDVVVAPDMAFATPADRSARVRSALGDAGERTMAIVPRRHPHAGPAADEAILDEFARLARDAVRRGLVDRVLVVAQCHGPTPIEDDRAIAHRLAARIGGDAVTVVDDDLTPGELTALYGGCALVVAVRLHAAILALSQGTPAFAIAYMTRKTEGVMAQAGLPGAWSGYAEFRAEKVLDQAATLMAPETRAALGTRGAEWQAALDRVADAWESPQPAH